MRLSKLTVRATCLITVLALSSVAAADLQVWDGPNTMGEITAPIRVGDGTESLVAFDLIFTSRSGGSVYSFSTDVAGSGPDRTGITGRLHHEQVFIGSIQQPSATLSDVLSDSPIDTHFNLRREELNSVGAPAVEPLVNDLSSREASNFPELDSIIYTGFTNTLAGNWVFTRDAPSGQGPTLNLARIVTPIAPVLWRNPSAPLWVVDGSDITLDFQALILDGNDFTREFVATSFSIVPEPTSLLLAVAGGAALLRRRLTRSRGEN